MTTKKSSLADALRLTKESVPSSSETITLGSERPQATAPNRIGKKSITGWFDADVLRQLKMIGVEQDKTIQQMVGEALNDFFIKYGKAQIAK